MRYFNGFSLYGEEGFLSDFLEVSDFTVAGFSYGAQRAFEYVYRSNARIEKLILLSPAFFQTEKKRFVRLQLRAFEQDKASYLRHFLANAAYPAKIDLSNYLQPESSETLEALLTYRWDEKKIAEVLSRGTQIEVYLGGRDRIIKSDDAFDFFSALAVTYLIKDFGHLLQSGE